MTEEHILTIDCGTQSIRGLIFDLKGSLVTKKQIHIEPYFSTAAGRAEQHVSVFWDSLCQACRGVLQENAVPLESIKAVALTTQRATMVNLDSQGQPLRPAIIWLDQRRTEGLPAVGGLWGLAFKLVGAAETIAYLQAEAESNWLRTEQPEVWNNTSKYLLLSGYLTYRLTGEYADSIGCQVGYIPFDYKTHDWSSSKDWKWKTLGIEKFMMPELHPPGDILGEISAQASEATGLPKGLPLVAAASDKACEVLGAGCMEPHIGCLSFGTTATINTIHSKYIEPLFLIPPYPAAIPGSYSLELQVFRGFWMVSWFKKEFGHVERATAKEKGVSAEELFDDLINTIPPGSEGLILQPYWSPGLRYPGPEARGAIIGFCDVHTRAHVYRAILEGLAYALRDSAERMTKRTKSPLTELRIAGGGSQSSTAMQLTADIFNLPASRPHIYEASGLGAAIDAAVGMKMHSDFSVALKEMTRVRDVFTPRPEVHEMYDQLYRSIYLEMYKKLKPLYLHLRHILKK